eukprot:Gb_20198 [translate_table: standard]
MAWLGKVSLGNFPDLAGAVNKFSESVKNIERNFDTALGFEEKTAVQEETWPSAERRALFDPVMSLMKQKNSDNSTEVQEGSQISKTTFLEGTSNILSAESPSEHVSEEIVSQQREEHPEPQARGQDLHPCSPKERDQHDPFPLEHSDHRPYLPPPRELEQDQYPSPSENAQMDARSQEFSETILPSEERKYQELPHAELEYSDRSSDGKNFLKGPKFVEGVEGIATAEPNESSEVRGSQENIPQAGIALQQTGANGPLVFEKTLNNASVPAEPEPNNPSSIISNIEDADDAKDSSELHMVDKSQAQDNATVSINGLPDSTVYAMRGKIEGPEKDTDIKQNHSESPIKPDPDISLVGESPIKPDIAVSLAGESDSEAEKLKAELKMMESALQGAARQAQAKADEITRLLNENEQLKNTIEDLKKKSPETESDALREEYQQRLGTLERKVYALTKERDTLRREQSRKSDAAALLKEKDEIIKQVMAEGEELSKKQAAQEAQMRKLRAQIRDLEEEKQRLNSKLQVEEAKVESIKRDKAATEKALQEAVERSQVELAAQKEFYTNALNEAKEAEALAEARANSEAKTELERRLREAADREAALVQALEELRETISITEREAASREDKLRGEIDELQKRSQATELRYEELVMRVPESTRPLLRQIEAMQETSAMRAEAWTGVERALNSRLQEAEAKAASAEERERAINERLSQTLSRMAVLEAQVSCLRAEQAQLTRSLEKERQRASENRQEYLAALETAASQEGRAKQLEDEIRELRNQHKHELVEEMARRELLEKELELERATRLDLEKTVRLETWAGTDRNPSSRHTNSYLEHGTNNHLRRFSSTGSASSMEESFYLQASLDSSSEQAHTDKRSTSELAASAYFAKGMVPSTLEHLEATLRQKDGELSSYMARLASLESIRDSLAEELVKMTNQCEKLRIEVSALPGLNAELEALRRRHASALELMGERDEELEELRADLADVKEMYREQVDMLVSQIEKLSSSLGSK